MEIAIFRMVQECLTNIHRHSGSDIPPRFACDEENHRIVIEVQDDGKGIPREKQVELSSSGRTGVGFRGMRERLRQLGGTLEIRSDGAGTAVTATLPLQGPGLSLKERSQKSPEVEDQSFSFTELLRLCPKSFVKIFFCRPQVSCGFFFNLRVIPVCSCRSHAP